MITPPAWTNDRVNALKKLWGQGKSASEIAEHLGGVTRNAVIGKAHRLGLSGRPSPIKKPSTIVRVVAKATSKVTSTKPAAKVATSTAKSTSAKTASKVIAPAPRPTAAAVRAAKTSVSVAAKAPTKPMPVVVPAPKAPSKNKPVVTPAERAQNPLAGQLAPPTPINPAANRPLSDAPLISILELSERVCRWPVGDPREPGFGFCGAPVQPGLPYCGGHAVLAFQAPARRDNRKLINVAPGVTVAPTDDDDLDDDLVVGDDADDDTTPLNDDDLDDDGSAVNL